MITTNEQVRLDVVMKCLHLTGDVDAAIHAARRIISFVAAGAADGLADGPTDGATDRTAADRTPFAAPGFGAGAPIVVERRARMDRSAQPSPDAAPVQAGAANAAGTPGPAGPPAKRGATGVGRGAGPKARWDEAAEEKLRREWCTGKSVDAIAVELGRTMGSVRERARRLGLRRPIPAERSAPSPSADSGRSGAAPVAGRRALKRGRGRRSGRGLAEAAAGRCAQPVDISNYRISRPVETLDSVVSFVRSRDYQVVRGDDGKFVVDGNKTFDRAGFVAWANGLRRMLNKPQFPAELAAAS